MKHYRNVTPHVRLCASAFIFMTDFVHNRIFGPDFGGESWHIFTKFLADQDNKQNAWFSGVGTRQNIL